MILDFRWVLYDIRSGINSGIPLCCIIWYTFFWNMFLLWKINLVKKIYHRVINGEFGYVICPICLILNYGVKVKTCSCIHPNYKKL